MKKNIFNILLFSFMLFFKVNANPVIPPPVISELYFVNNNWVLELVFDASHGVSNSNNLVIVTSTDTVPFKPGFSILLNVPIIINQDSLLSPLSINKNGDFVTIAINNSGSLYYLDFSPIRFGSIANAEVSSPLPGESIKKYRSYSAYNQTYTYYTVKDSNPTIGTNAFESACGSSFSGYVFDSNHNPVPSATIYGNTYISNSPIDYPVTTNANGFFFRQNLYSYIRNLSIQLPYCNSIDTTFSIEPDSSYYMEFAFDSCVVSTNDLVKTNNCYFQIFPNPGSENFTFSIDISQPSSNSFLIKIYNINGELVDMIPIINNNDRHINVPWNGKGKYFDLTAGIYTCSLEISGMPVLSQKLIIAE